MSNPPPFSVQPPTAGVSEILIYGARTALFTAVVRTYDVPGSLSYYAIESPGRPLFERRWRTPGKPVESVNDVSDLVTCVVLHDDPGDPLAGFRSRAAKLQSMHFHIDWDGAIFQTLDVADAAHHAGAADQSSIGVALARGRVGKEYSDRQYTALIDLLRTLRRTLKRIDGDYPIDRFGRVFPQARWQKGDWHGFLGNRHVNDTASDPAPPFDWEALRMRLLDRLESFPVELADGANIKTLPPDRILALAELYAENNETKTNGWYPMGINRTWHGGIHIAAPFGTRVCAMTDGVLVAACIDPKPKKVGHRGFVLLRHTVPGPRTVSGVETEGFAYFTLLMHLGAVVVEPKWLEQLRLSNHPALTKLESGEITAIEWRQNPVRVLSGEFVGVVGQFGPEPEAQSMVHVEVFAGNLWQRIQGMLGADFFESLKIDTNATRVEDQRVLEVFGADLSPDGLQAFWSNRDLAVAAKRWLRKLVVRHVSEWSDQVDWPRTIAAVNGWDKDPVAIAKMKRDPRIARDLAETVSPFIWLNKSMAAHIGLDVRDWNGAVEHFHPIQFLMWLQFRAGRRFVNGAP